MEQWLLAKSWSDSALMIWCGHVVINDEIDDGKTSHINEVACLKNAQKVHRIL